MKWIMTVGQMSKLFNITAETLRHYDRIGLLKPIVDEENGYRYYSIKEMEKLDLILKIKEQAKEKKTILNEMMNFKNNYNFEELEIVKEDNIILNIPIEAIVQGKIKQKDSSLKSMYLEPWMIKYKVKDKNTIIDDKEYMTIYEKNTDNLLIDEKIKIYKTNYSKKLIKTKFVGTFDEIEDYIMSIVKHFYKNKDNLDLDINISFIWSVYNEKATINFVEIDIPLNI